MDTFNHNILYRGLLWVILFFFIFLYLVVPLYNYPFESSWYYFEIGVYLLGVCCFYKIKRKKNFFDFDTIFLASCSIEHFFGFIYLGTEEFDTLFYSSIDTTLISKATLLAFIGLLSYMIGASLKERDENQLYEKLLENKSFKYLSPTVIILLFLVCFVIFYVSRGYEFYESQYMLGVGIVKGDRRVFQMTTLMTVLSNLLCVRLLLEYVHNKKLSFLNFIYFLIVILFAFSIVIVGNRTVFSYIVLPYLFCFFYHYKELNIFRTITLLLIGAIGMYIIQITRQGESVVTMTTFHILSDLIVVEKPFLGALEYVDKYGLDYGISMIHSFTALIPGLSSMLGDYANLGSAEILTRYLSDPDSSAGLGTTIIADIYLPFGAVGVVVLMFMLGVFVHTTWKNPITDTIIQVSLFSSCIFMVRSSYFLPLLSIVWSLIIYYFVIALRNVPKK